jgi:ATP-binding cassette, subfamily C, bacterial CydD
VLPLAGAAALIALRAAAGLTAGASARSGGGALQRGIRARLAAAMPALGPVRVGGERAGELVYALGEGTEALETALVRADTAKALAVAVPLLVLVAVALSDPWSLLVLLFAGPILVALLALIGRRVRGMSERREHELAWLHGFALDLIRGLPTLRLFGRARDQAETLETLSARYARSSMDVLRVAFQSTLVLEWGATAATAMVAIETSVRVMSGDLAFGTALFVLLVTPECFVPLRRLAAEYHAGTAGDAAAVRIASLFERAATADHGGARRRPPTPPAIAFDDVRVAFEDGRRLALDGCSLSIASGERVAIVGVTGAGKSTVAATLLGFATPARGLVTIDGEALATLDLDAWRRQVAWVPQRPVAGHGTVAEVLRMGDPRADDDRLWAAVEAAGARDLVEGLPDRLGTAIGEGGVRLSGGERQLLALARACVRDAPLLLLDEPTAHLGGAARRGVLARLPALLEGRTAIVIAHDEDVLAAVDRVIELRRGRVLHERRPMPAGGVR